MTNTPYLDKILENIRQNLSTFVDSTFMSTQMHLTGKFRVQHYSDGKWVNFWEDTIE